MIILGVNDGHNASAALLVDGELISAISEDRPSRQSTRSGFPFGAIEQCLKLGGIKKSDVDHLAISTLGLPPKYFWVPRENFSYDDYRREQNEYWAPRFDNLKAPDYLDVFNDKIDKQRFIYDQSLIKNEEDVEGMLEARLRHAETYMGLNRKSISVHDHHACHAYYGWLAHPIKNRDLLIFTADGGGDKSNGTVWVAKSGEVIQEISRTSKCNIGRMYRYATLILGMKQFEHAYKVMGLAPYSNKNIGSKAYKIYKETLKVDGLDFDYQVKPKDHYFYFKEKLDGLRFDGIAWGIQKRTEELLAKWVNNGIDITGIKDVVFSGGVAMNIKANKTIWESPNVDSIFVPPGSGDESISIGAAFKVAVNNPSCASESIKEIMPFKSVYLGMSYTNDEVQNQINAMNLSDDYVVRKVQPKDVAVILASGDVVARFFGRGEFGPRALGNRSIIADPRNPKVVQVINKMIKQRDFWMPFAASILEERAKDYIINPKGLIGDYMTVAFDSTELAQKDLPSGLHPYDMTCRPQIVSYEKNSEHHTLIKAFESITGVGALLNTSFNLHGEPIVASPKDAIKTFINSGLKHVLIQDFLISKLK